MSESEPYDLLIIGGGCAGLSLAMRLARLGPGAPRTLILEKREVYNHDRTWCFWDWADGVLAPLVAHRWDHFTVSAKGRSLSLRCPDLPYQMIPALAFYHQALDEIEGSPRLQISLGEDVEGRPQRCPQGWEMPTKRGLILARAVVDTRPLRLPSRDRKTLWQSFYGQEVECQSDVFEPGQADLMDFLDGPEQDVRFLYVLPTSKRRALLELTVFGAEPLEAAALSQQLDQLISRKLGDASYTVHRSESGILPMGPSQSKDSSDPSYVQAGLFAGGARPSTGYAFLRIQRWAASCCLSLSQGKGPLPHAPDPMIQRFMDHLFLEVLRAHPEISPELFLALFEKTPTPSLLRFLTDRAGLIDFTRVALALPPGLFIRQLLRQLLLYTGLKTPWTQPC